MLTRSLSAATVCSNVFIAAACWLTEADIENDRYRFCDHQVRGSLSRFGTESLRGAAFGRCTACSDTVVDGYREGGYRFLLQAFNGGSYLEDLTGLTELHKEAEAALESVDFFDDEDEDGELL